MIKLKSSTWSSSKHYWVLKIGFHELSWVWDDWRRNSTKEISIAYFTPLMHPLRVGRSDTYVDRIHYFPLLAMHELHQQGQVAVGILGSSSKKVRMQKQRKWFLRTLRKIMGCLLSLLRRRYFCLGTAAIMYHVIKIRSRPRALWALRGRSRLVQRLPHSRSMFLRIPNWFSALIQPDPSPSQMGN